MIEDKWITNSTSETLSKEYRDALDCLEKIMANGGRNGQCLECKYNQFCSGAFQHILIPSSEES